jgi:hypothetical protein
VAAILTVMKNIAAVAVAAVGITVGAVGLATAAPGDAPTNAAPESTTTIPKRPGGPGARGEKPGPLGRTVHGDLIVATKDGGFEKITVDRGTLTDSDADSLTLHRPDGVDVTVKLNSETRYPGLSNTELQKGQPVTVVAKDGTARIVMQRDPDAQRKGPGMRRPGMRRPGEGPPDGAPPAGA